MEDIVMAVCVFVGLPWALFSGIAKVKAAKAAEGVGLRASELEGLIRNAVQDATQPMRERLETLEAIVTDDEPRRQPLGDLRDEPRLDPAVLADALGADETDLSARDETAATRRRTRD